MSRDQVAQRELSDRAERQARHALDAKAGEVRVLRTALEAALADLEEARAEAVEWRTRALSAEAFADLHDAA